MSVCQVPQSSSFFEPRVSTYETRNILTIQETLSPLSQEKFTILRRLESFSSAKIFGFLIVNCRCINTGFNPWTAIRAGRNCRI